MHLAFVDAWLGGADETLSPEQLMTLFDRAMAALWRRSVLTLGEITLWAIVDRVVTIASETYPFLSTLTVEKTGIGFDGFREQGAHHPDLRPAVRLMLVEFLTVLGRLTDEILTPALHAELAKVALDEPGASSGDVDRARGPRS